MKSSTAKLTEYVIAYSAGVAPPMRFSDKQDAINWAKDYNKTPSYVDRNRKVPRVRIIKETHTYEEIPYV